MNSMGRTCGNGQKVAEKDSSSAYMSLQDGNSFNASPKGGDVWSSARRNTNNRCGYFTFLSADPNGIWRAVAVPINYLNVGVSAGSGSQSFTDGTFSGAKGHYHSRSKALTNKFRRGETLPGKSSGHSSFNRNDFNVTNLSDISKLGKNGKKNNTKKTKKGKRNQRRSLDAGSAHVAGVVGSATDGTGSCNNTDPGAGPISWETTSTVLSPDSCGDSSEENCSGSAKYSETSKRFNSNVEKVDTLEAKCGDQTAIPDLYALKTVQGSIYDSVCCMDDSGSRVVAEANSSLVLGSSPVCSKADVVASSSNINVDTRHKGSRKEPRNFSVSKKNSLRKFHGQSAEKNNISWQEVCGNVTDKYSSGMGKIESIGCEGVNSLKIVLFPEQNHNVAQTKMLSAGEDKHQSKVRNPGKTKRNTSAGSKQELNCHWRKSLYASKSTSNICSKIDTELNNKIGISRPLPKVNCAIIESGAEKIESSPCGYVKLEGCSSKDESLPQNNSSPCSLNDQYFVHKCKLIPTDFKAGNQGELFDFSAIKHNNNNQVSGPFMHKWIPIGFKDTELSRSTLSNSSQSVKVSKEKFNSESTAMKMASSEAFDCSVNSTIMCFEQSSKTKNAQHPETKVPTCNASVESAVCNESDMILQAVNDAYKAQLASAAVENAIGCTIAELERFLRAASPVIPLSNNNTSCCLTCLSDGVPAKPLCRHKIPNLSLGNLWQWYEKHGIFGLEVKAEDYDNSKRLGMDRIQFRAYFVPFLSAVQLFHCRRSSSDTSRRIPDIFSILVPQSKIVGSDTKRVDDSTSSDELELLYEYFEAEQPQQRRPLFEMINDLVSGNEPSQGRAFGDPSKLDSMAFNDLHPKSWYSVAWYPIYRIPDEKFHSAFLTYHSLGHLVPGSALSDSFGGNACVVSPVVGLQSYNTKGECWLQPRNLPKEIRNYNHIEILKERLKTLEHTASVMARAQVVKGNVTSVNRQPDYEFFLSKRRW